MTDLTTLTIAQARDGLKRKSFSATELADAHIAAVERARVATRPAWCFAAGVEVDFGVYDRALLGADDFMSGPAIVDEGTSTTVVMSDQAVRVDDHGQLLVTEVET